MWIRFLSGPDIDLLGLQNAEIIDAVEGAVRAHGEGSAVVEPRVHLIPDNGGAGHFNVLRGHLPGRRDGDPPGRRDGDLAAELGQIVTGQRPGRQGPAERILLWHRGLAILDIAVGQLILAKAQQAGIGTMLRYR